MYLPMRTVTQHLSASAYLDPFFRHRALGMTEDTKPRAVGPSYGMDLAVVLAHCRAAQRRVTRRNLLLVGAYIVAAALSGAGAVAWILLFLVGWLVVSAERWTSLYRTVARDIMNGSEGLSAAADALPGEGTAATETLPLVVYGGFSPFVGSGWVIGGWSFALNVRKGKELLGVAAEPVPFQTADLYRRLARDVHAMGIQEVEIEDRLFAGGRHIGDDQRFLPHPAAAPRSRVERAVLEGGADVPSEYVRRYLCVQSTAWGGELVLTMCLRFRQVGSSLFAEASYLLLPPLKRSHHRADALAVHPSIGQRLAFFLGTAMLSPFLVVLAPFALLLRAYHRFQRFVEGKFRPEGRRAAHNPAHNYGAQGSLREKESAKKFTEYFQRLDQDLYLKVVEQQVLDSITTFLDERNIDTQSLRDRQATILNSGVIVSGGRLNAESLAVGQQASIWDRATAGAANAARSAPGATQ